jgi:hypothetical protein
MGKAHPLTGQAVRYKARKNDKFANLPVLPELQAFMGELKVQRADGLIADRDDGTVWPSEKEMQTRVSHWLRDQERAGHMRRHHAARSARVLRRLVEAQRRQHPRHLTGMVLRPRYAMNGNPQNEKLRRSRSWFAAISECRGTH